MSNDKQPQPARPKPEPSREGVKHNIPPNVTRPTQTPPVKK